MNRPSENDDGIKKTQRGFGRLSGRHERAKAITQRLEKGGLSEEDNRFVREMMVDIYPSLESVLEEGDQIIKVEEKDGYTHVTIKKNGMSSHQIVRFPTPSTKIGQSSVNLLPRLVLSNEFEKINVEAMPDKDRGELLGQITSQIKVFQARYKETGDPVTKANMDLLIEKRKEIFGVREKEENKRKSERLTRPLDLLNEVIDSPSQGASEAPDAIEMLDQTPPMQSVVKRVRVRLEKTFGPGLNIFPRNIEKAKKRLVSAREEIDAAQREHKDYDTARKLLSVINGLIKKAVKTPSQSPSEAIESSARRVDPEKKRKLYGFMKNLIKLINSEAKQAKKKILLDFREVLHKVFLISFDGGKFEAKSAIAINSIDVDLLQDLKEEDIIRLSIHVVTLNTYDNKKRETELRFLGMDGDKVKGLAKAIVTHYLKSKGQTERFESSKLSGLSLASEKEDQGRWESESEKLQQRVDDLKGLFPGQLDDSKNEVEKRLARWSAAQTPDEEREKSLVILKGDIEKLESSLMGNLLESAGKRLDPYESLLIKVSHLRVLSEDLKANMSDYKKVCERFKEQKELEEEGSPRRKNEFSVSETTANQAKVALQEYGPLQAQAEQLHDFISKRLRSLRESQNEEETQERLKLMDLRAHELIKAISKMNHSAKRNSTQIDTYIGRQHIKAFEAAKKYPSLKEAFEASQKTFQEALQRLQALIIDSANTCVNTHLPECYRDLNVQMKGVPGVQVTKAEYKKWEDLFKQTRVHEEHIRKKLLEWQETKVQDERGRKKILQDLDGYIESVVKPHIKNVRDVLHRVSANKDELSSNREIDKVKRDVMSSRTELTRVGHEVTSEQLSRASGELESLMSERTRAEESGNTNRVQELEAEIKRLRREKNELEIKLKAFKREADKPEKERQQEVLTAAPIFDDAELERLKSDLEAQKLRAEEQVKKSNELNQAIREVRSEREDLETRIGELEKQLEEAQSEKEQVQEQLETAQTFVKDKEARVTKLEKDLANKEIELAEKERLHTEEQQNAVNNFQKQLESETKTLREQIQKLIKEKEDAEAAKTEAIEQVEQFKEKAERSQEDLTAKVTELSGVRERLKTVEDQLEEKDEALTKVNQKLSQYDLTSATASGLDQGAAAELRRELQEEKNKIKELKEKIKKQNARITAFKRGGKVRDKNREIKNKQIKELEKNLGVTALDKKEAILEKELAIEKLEKEIRDHDLTYEELEAKREELEKLYDGHREDLEAHLKDIIEQVTKKATQLENLEIEVERLKEQSEEFNENLRAYQEKSEELSGSIEQSTGYIKSLNTQTAQLLHGSKGLEAWIDQRKTLKKRRRELSQEITTLKRIQQNKVKAEAIASIIKQLESKLKQAQKDENTERAEKLEGLIQEQKIALEKAKRSVKKAEKISELETELENVKQELILADGKIQQVLDYTPQVKESTDIIQVQEEVRGRFVAIIKSLLKEQKNDVDLSDLNAAELPKSANKTFSNLTGQWQREVDREQALYDLATTQAELKRVKEELEWAQKNPKAFLQARLQELHGEESTDDEQ